ncbi:DNA-directed RNA polymerase subunit alpha [Candidatus Roizmanbacteria bacterium CG22_combo_CG10-13_8_21_14_all_38_20]|uniref:DNA-directed RNA polymerase subunit alpha n=1 Tax=Candidatus Roizmanbacteria bacterium CG22_combo_CG10-13_8_21_14_all_38_20 TaxID=1974862 RepID=A0A2H0BWR5_9BACT|nr:DNA-directed RNA polymerase subunit alpha [Candidatus Microgenomates bacterium]PIP62126.1 MAG: DNA-directed RNA polymerase subunit alpha [Candidatus Roizmanbacteria bacterium CG22_combo_CG10-13_8_21_14_all_38_20]PJC31852.1 MAG: DNA-directed RNA polymerase subunit alpha [Candidatus Roizmanbacteria bacterium CG_4_9_14_0_2_um_filter_38_17]
MQDFEVKAIEEKLGYAKLEITPLAQGYGDTIGNALRRILISSLPGAAATKVKIKGVQHRFSTLVGMKEDVIELLLNLKEVRFDLKGSDSAQVKLSKSGPGLITAGDFELSGGVEVVNKDQVLANLANKNNKLEMEVDVESGYGYSPFEERKLEKVGLLPIDAVYSPVLRVSYKVEETRVGRMTNLDRLILEVWTDGTISPQDAVKQSAKILSQYMTRISGGETISAPLAVEEKDEESVEALELNTRVENALKKEGIETVRQLAQYKRADVKKIKNMGQKSVQEIKEKLEDRGLSFKE